MTTISKGGRVVGVQHGTHRGNDFFPLGMIGTIEGVDQFIHVRWDDGTKSLCMMAEIENEPT